MEKDGDDHGEQAVCMPDDPAYQAAHKAVHDVFLHFGVDTDSADSLREFNSSLEYLRKAQRGSEEIGKWTRRSFVLTGIGAITWAIWEGFKHALDRGGH